MTRDFHYDRFWNSRFPHISIEAMTGIMKDQSVFCSSAIWNVSITASPFKSSPDVLYWFPFEEKNMVIVNSLGNTCQYVIQSITDGNSPLLSVFYLAWSNRTIQTKMEVKDYSSTSTIVINFTGQILINLSNH
jgi:hypothetical protein